MKAIEQEENGLIELGRRNSIKEFIDIVRRMYEDSMLMVGATKGRLRHWEPEMLMQAKPLRRR